MNHCKNYFCKDVTKALSSKRNEFKHISILYNRSKKRIFNVDTHSLKYLQTPEYKTMQRRVNDGTPFEPKKMSNEGIWKFLPSKHSHHILSLER